MEHLRELDSVKEGIGLRAFGQKDPLLEYKREAFEMFKQLLDEINQTAISLIWKAIPEMQADQRLQQAQKEKAKVDMAKAKTQHSDSTNMGYKQMAGQEQNGSGQQQRSDRKPQPVTVEDEPGRNDYVKIQNMNSGKVIDIKWKKAKRMIDKDGWILIEK
jgi:preprotein translocase subunit SecA